MLLTILFLLVIIYFFTKRYVKNYWWFGGTLVLKLLAGIGIGILYYNYYQYGDTIKFVEELRHIQEFSWQEWWLYLTNQHLPESVWFGEIHPRVIVFLKPLVIINLITQGSYWALSLWLSTFSFLACWWFYTVIIRVYPHLQKLIFFCLFLNPSFVFWTSGVMKESLLVGCVFICQGILLGIVYQKLSKPIWIYALLCLPILLFIWKVKYYFAATLIGFMLPYLLVKIFCKKEKIQLPIYLLIVTLGLFTASFLHPNLRLENVLDAIVTNHDKTIKLSPVKGYIVYTHLEPTIISFVRNMPKALLSGLFSPLSIQWNIRIVESIINWSMLLILGFNLRYYFQYKWKIEVWVCILFISFLAVFLAFASPNYGSLIRYKTVYLPWFWLLILYPYYNFFPINKKDVRHQPRIDEPTNSKK